MSEVFNLRKEILNEKQMSEVYTNIILIGVFLPNIDKYVYRTIDYDT